MDNFLTANAVGNFSVVDMVIVAIYLISCISLGMFHRKKITSIKEFTLGSNITSKLLLVTIFGTYMEAGGTMGIVEKVFSMGLGFCFIFLMSIIGLWKFNSFIFSNIRFTYFMRHISLSGIMNEISGPTGLWTCNISSFCYSIGVVALQTLALGQITHYLFGIEEIYGMVIGIGIITLYSSFGGMKAVVITDMLQFWVFMVGIPLAAAMDFGNTVRDFGGGHITNVFKNLPTHAKDVSLNWELVSIFLLFCLPATHYAFVQRYLMAESTKQLEDTFNKVLFVNLFWGLCTCLIGIAVLVKAPDINPNDAFMYFVDHSVMIGLKGLIFAGLLAILMSTADSWLQSAGVIVGHDILKTLLPKITEKQQIVVARFTIVFCGIFSVLIATQMTSIIDGLFMVFNFWDPLITVPLCSAIMGFKSERMSYKVATATALIGVGIGHYIDGQFGAISVLTGIVGNAIGLFGTHYICGFNKKDYKDKEEQLAEELSA